jgi:hypothetical protein
LSEPPNPEASHTEVAETPQADALNSTIPSRLKMIEFLRAWGGWICLGALALQVVLLGAGFSKWIGPLLEVTGLSILIFAIGTAIVCESDPQKSDRSTVQRWGALATAVILMLGFGSSNTIVWFFSLLNDLGTQVQKYPLVIIGLIILALLLSGWWFVRVFTTPLPIDGPVTEKDLMPMVRFCYVFTLMVLAISVVGPVLIILFPNPDYDLVARGPVSLVKGCVHSDNLKWELACDEKDPFKLEWFINIGGAARPGSLPSSGPTSKYSVVDTWIEAKSYRPMIVHGGLVIPWYFIALALMGAAVSLARRIPEYQRRALDQNDKEFTAPRARECMEFQILQLLSAPLIAVAAYNLVTPYTLQASTAIGFITGFSSETILVAIGALADRLIGKSAKEEPKKEEAKKEETKKEEPQK